MRERELGEWCRNVVRIKEDARLRDRDDAQSVEFTVSIVHAVRHSPNPAP